MDAAFTPIARYRHFLSEQEGPSQKTLYAEGMGEWAKPTSTSV